MIYLGLMSAPKSSNRSSKYFLIFSLLGIFQFLAGSASWAVSDPTSCVITIKSVQLKSDKGQWITVIEPDHEVDIVKEEPGLSFFNRGRVPEGKYTNFKLTLLEAVKVTDAGGRFCTAVRPTGGAPGAIEISGAKDFEEPIRLKKGSFIGVWFSVDLKGTIEGNLFRVPEKVSGLTITVDENSRNLSPEGVQVKL